MTATDVRRELTSSLLLTGVFLMIAALAIIDLVLDARSVSGAHALTEAALAAGGIAAAAVYARRVRVLAREARALADEAHQLRAHAEELASHLATSRADAERWRRESHDLIAGLAGAIDAQLVRWGLTAAEKEVALLLLKGLSHKEIAEARGVAETTVRQQARALYKKAGLGGRNDLAAFFLEDLLGPQPVTAPGP
ncbi:MAG: helix-turn-helix transcriptional regulator [Kofleriaceae bacterium]